MDAFSTISLNSKICCIVLLSLLNPACSSAMYSSVCTFSLFRSIDIRIFPCGLSKLWSYSFYILSSHLSLAMLPTSLLSIPLALFLLSTLCYIRHVTQCGKVTQCGNTVWYHIHPLHLHHLL